MRPKSTDRNKARKRGAVKSVAVFVLLQLAASALLLWLALTPDMPVWLSRLMLVLAAVNMLSLLPSGIVLKQRFQEIEGGELDEAGKY